MPVPRPPKPDPRQLLPRDAYVGQDWFDREQTELFARAWLFAGLVTDVPAPGDYLSVMAGREPLVIVRQADGRLAAFLNICRHRGVVLLEGRGNVAAGISCFYHRWHYNLDGSLRGVPQAGQFPGVVADKARFGLRAASVGEFNGMIFVNADPAPAETLGQWLGRVPDDWGPWRPAELFELPASAIEVAANWKLFIENHVDGLHLWHLHARSVQGLDHDRQYWVARGRHWMFYEPESVAGSIPERRTIRLPAIPGVDALRYGSSVYMLFPNIGIAAGVTFLAIFVVTPLAPDRSRVSFRTFVKPIVVQDFIDDPGLAESLGASAGQLSLGSAAAGDAPFADRLEAAARAGDFVAEDKLAAEAVQRALGSRRFAVGPLASDYEAAITFFQRNLQDFIGDWSG